MDRVTEPRRLIAQESTISNDVQVFRNRTNHIAGIVLQFMFAGLWVLNDPLQLRGDWPAGVAFGPVGAAVIALTLGCLAVIALAVWWYPRVEVRAQVLTILNPLRTVVIPRGRIQKVDDSGFLVRVQTDERTYRCAGLETSLAMMLSADPHSSTGRTLAAVQPTSDRDLTAPVQVQWRRPTALEVTVGAAWLTLAVASLIVAR